MKLYCLENYINDISDEQIGAYIRKLNAYLNEEPEPELEGIAAMIWQETRILYGKQLRDNRRTRRKQKGAKSNGKK